ncbi:MAG TPA: peptide ABC transporter substrate-binding protein [Egibacteraceae bacterium]|nr:peptide ABC transporter substrate-binding protein [Egibacteraceae bacterium]
MSADARDRVAAADARDRAGARGRRGRKPARGMRRLARALRRLVSMIVVAAIAAACSAPGRDAESSGPDAGPTRRAGGAVVYGAEQEPAILNPLLVEGGLLATASVVVPVLWPLWRIRPDFTYEPLLLDGEPEVSVDPFAVTYRLRDEAVWSDGVPITAHDVLFTIETKLDERFDINSVAGFDLIDLDATEVIDDKTIKVVFSEPFAPWRALFSTADGVILPRHALEGEDFNTIWNDGIVGADGEPIASGPFKLASWTRGQQLVLERNEAFWGEPAGLDQLVVRFMADSDTQVQALRGGEVDVLYPLPQPDLMDSLGGLDGVTLEVDHGPVWEHLDFNLVIPGLDQLAVRQAIAQAIDREAIAAQLIAPLAGGQADPLHSVIYVANQSEYEPHFDRWRFDPDGAVRALEEAGCAKADDGIFVCDGVRLSFAYAATSGNQLRELQFEVIQAQLADIGIEVTPALGEPAEVYGSVLPAGPDGAWDLFVYAYSGSPDPFENNTLYRCGGEQNFTSYCDEEVTRLLDETEREPDAAERVRLYNEVDSLIAEDLPLLPLYQIPQPMAFRSDLSGPQNNTTQWGPLWNLEEWELTRE